MNSQQNRTFRPAAQHDIPSQTEISRRELEEELKKTQIENSELRQRVRELQAQIVEFQIQISGKPKELENNEKAITTFGRRFCVMNEPFYPDNLLQLSPANMDFDPFDPITRYETPASQIQGFVAELYYELPEDLHDVMKHSKMLVLFRNGHKNERSHIISQLRANAPRIFIAYGTFTPSQFEVGRTPGNQPPLFGELIGAADNYPLWAPILFPDLKDTSNIEKAFMTPSFKILLKFILFKARAFDSDNQRPRTGPKPAGKAWGVTQTTPGLIAFGAIVARFLFSPDKTFEARGAISSINYAEDFMTYKRILLAGLQEKLQATISLFRTFNLYLFDNDSDNFAASDPVDDTDNPQTESISRLDSDFTNAMQRLRIREGTAEIELLATPNPSVNSGSLITQPPVGETQATPSVPDADAEPLHDITDSATVTDTRDHVDNQNSPDVIVHAEEAPTKRGRGRGRGRGGMSVAVTEPRQTRTRRGASRGGN